MAIVQKIVIGSDHAGYDLKQEIIAHLKSLGLEVLDVGTYSKDSCHYPEFAKALCQKIQSGEFKLGILICGTGIGMSMAANKCRGIRAACCSDSYSARLTREHNDANVPLPTPSLSMKWKTWHVTRVTRCSRVSPSSTP